MKHTLLMALVLSAVCGCEDARRPDPVRPLDNPDPLLVRHDGLWNEIRSWGDWAEGKPTFSQLVDSADAAVVARLVAAKAGRVVDSDGSSELYTEILVHAEVTEVLRDSTEEETVTFSLSLLSATSLDARDESLASAQSALPIDNVLLVLRQPEDEDYYRVVNGYGIWAATTRGKIDAPLEPAAPLRREEPFIYDREIGRLQSIEELVDSLR